ncbi:MAG: sensor histidine kinase, partial [bacterium]
HIPQVYADRDAVVQIPTNLIDNARKYSPEHTTVTLSLTVKGNHIEMAVADQGYGIPLSQIENIFKRFTRLVDQDDPRFQEGVGLGLPLVKDLITRHGGDIWVESEEGNGSTFHFTLQIAEGSEEMRPA